MVRRVVTGETEAGDALVSDGVAPAFDMGGGAQVFEVWVAPHADGGYPAGTGWSLVPPTGGSVFRIAEFPPKSEGEEPYMHRTPTIDYGVIIEGELCLLVGDREVALAAGDTFVQRQADHAWVNRSDRRCRMAVVLIDGAQ